MGCGGLPFRIADIVASEKTDIAGRERLTGSPT
jgi:hypothetical protein